ncbi:hypothetical protein D0962_22855 [Leptolyngbyaceae cyanobacterium CCMR0082]|uniref:Uncharacterized protein n=1 Tax=Adonisia turfae CCMR0082 TaxID=2304604 RepID=A0A6M0SC48_9CYAN|nr:hypothetical protein [Adonisia turfae]NEZ65561.1 hypothetical protein [Adonisia turfae CCMR0082]
MTIGYGSELSPQQIRDERDRYDLPTQVSRARELSNAYEKGRNRQPLDIEKAVLTGDTELVSKWVAGVLSTTDGNGLAVMKQSFSNILRYSNPDARPANMRPYPSYGHTTIHGYSEV